MNCSFISVTYLLSYLTTTPRGVGKTVHVVRVYMYYYQIYIYSNYLKL